MLSLCTSLTRNAPHFTSRTHHDRTSAHAAARLKPTAPQHLSHLAARNRGAAAEPHLATSGAGGAAARLDDPRSAPRSAGDACGAGPAAAGAGRALFRPGRAAGPHSGGGPGGATGGERRRTRTRGYALGAMVPPAGARLLPLPGRGPLLGVLLLLLLCSGGGCVPRRRPAGPPVVLGKSRAGGGAGRARSGAEPCPCLCRGARRAREAPAAPVPRSAAPGVCGERRLRVTALTASGWKQRAWLRALRRQRVLPACAAGNAR